MGQVAAGAGLVAGLLNNERNRKDASRARDASLQQALLLQQMQRPLIDRQVLLYDTIKGIVDKASAQGQFNPDWLLNTLKNDTKRLQAETVGNLAGSMKSLGYSPGDSEIGVRMDSALAKTYADYMDNEAAIRQGALQNEINAYGQVGQAANLLNAAGQMMAGGAGMNAGIQSGLANYYQGQIQNPAGLISAFMPFLESQKGGQQKASIGMNSASSSPQTPIPTPTKKNGIVPSIGQNNAVMGTNGFNASIVDSFNNTTERMTSNRSAGGLTLSDLFAGNLGLPSYGTTNVAQTPMTLSDLMRGSWNPAVQPTGQKSPWDHPARVGGWF